MTQSLNILAARYALGVADAPEIARAESLLSSDPGFAAEVAKYQITFDGLHDGITPVAPPPGVWDRIASAIGAPEPRPQTVSPKDIPWQPVAPNLDMKILLDNPDTGIRMVLFRAGPGAVVERHRNPASEECIVLEGEIEINGTVLKAGDMQMIAPGTMHGPITSRNGALVYIREHSH